MNEKITPLQALLTLEYRYNALGIKFKESGWHLQGSPEYIIVETALNELQEYKAILEDFGLENPQNLIDNLNIIRNCKFHKQLKALDIIEDKQVNVAALLELDDLKQYNDYCDMVGGCKKLTLEEYDLLRKVLL